MPLSCTRPRSPRSPREAGSDHWQSETHRDQVVVRGALQIQYGNQRGIVLGPGADEKWIAKLDRIQAARTLFFVDSKHFQFWPSFSDCILLCRVLQSFVQQMSWKLTSRALGELQHFLNWCAEVRWLLTRTCTVALVSRTKTALRAVARLLLPERFCVRCGPWFRFRSTASINFVFVFVIDSNWWAWKTYRERERELHETLCSLRREQELSLDMSWPFGTICEPLDSSHIWDWSWSRWFCRLHSMHLTFTAGPW